MDIQFYDWVLTSVDEVRFSTPGPPSLCLAQRLSRQFYFLWRRERITYTRVVFALARYPALVCSIMYLLPVRHTRNKEQRLMLTGEQTTTVKLDYARTLLRFVTVICSECKCVSVIGYYG